MLAGAAVLLAAGVAALAAAAGVAALLAAADRDAS
jgi:hypothetical protein